MAEICFSDVNVEIPVYNGNYQSLKRHLINLSTGGLLNIDESGRTFISAIRNINIKITDGQRVGLIGHNGAGKSSLLRVLSGIYPPTKGLAEIRGNVVSLIDISAGFNRELTGRENILLRARLIGIELSKIKDKMNEIIEFSGLGIYIDVPLRTYSSGMQLRLAFSISTIVEPEILIMDEWLSTGDKEFRKMATNKLNDLITVSSILVIASHSQELIQKVCNRVIWLEHGIVKMDGNPIDVCSAYFG